jgi:hypothetical protein
MDNYSGTRITTLEGHISKLDDIILTEEFGEKVAIPELEMVKTIFEKRLEYWKEWENKNVKHKEIK